MVPVRAASFISSFDGGRFLNCRLCSVARKGAVMSTLTSNTTLFDLDRELDLLLDEIQEQVEVNGENNVSPTLIEQFQGFCHAYGQKVDRIGHFLLNLDARAQHCRDEAARLAERARFAENKASRTKKMVLYYFECRGLKKVEGLETTLRMQKNSQDSVIIRDEKQVPLDYREIEAKIPGSFWHEIQAHLSEVEKQVLNSYIRHSEPSPSAIKAAKLIDEQVPGAEVKRAHHLRVE
jgi:hypothetical protein